MSRFNPLPTSIDQLPRDYIAKQASKIKQFTPEQREIFFYNGWRGLPKSREDLEIHYLA